MKTVEKLAMANKLGETQITDRGFELIEFTDANGVKCSLQQSSAIGQGPEDFDRPGSSFIWLGCAQNAAPHMGHEMSPRMHLNHDQADALMECLVNWGNTGSFDKEA